VENYFENNFVSTVYRYIHVKGMPPVASSWMCCNPLCGKQFQVMLHNLHSNIGQLYIIYICYRRFSLSVCLYRQRPPLVGEVNANFCG
jgi:hypothetical protein